VKSGHYKQKLSHSDFAKTIPTRYPIVGVT